MIKERTNGSVRGGGGNRPFLANRIIVRRSAAIGDAVCATTVADRLISLGYEVDFQTHPMVQCVIRRHPLIGEVSEAAGFTDVNLDGAYEHDPARRIKHFHQMFFERASEQLGRFGIILGTSANAKARLVMPERDKTAVRKQFAQYDRPWVFVCPRSDTYNVRTVHDAVWAAAAAKIAGTKFWIGRHPAPPNFIDLKARHFDNVMDWLSIADILVTVDTGPMHVAAAFGVPVIAMNQSSSPELHLSDQCDYAMVTPALDCLNCQQNVCPKVAHMPPCQNIDPEAIAAWTNARLHSIFDQGISALIPTHRPTAERLNRCIGAVLPQVREVIVSMGGDAVLPAGVLQHPKVRYVQKRLGHLGFGKNVNYGFRHTNSRWVMLLNDDVFLEPDVIAKVAALRKPGIGIISHLLRYPSGEIQFGGKHRRPGDRGWGHTDHRALGPSATGPKEQEVACAASILIDRRAFYEVNGFDERFHMYSEDDDFCMRVRRQGYKIIFTPHACGVHEESQTSKQSPDMLNWIRESNALMERLWGRYWDVNRDREIGSFDY